MSTETKPWHESPRCKCGGPLVTYPGRVEFRPGARLRCCACGGQRYGTNDEYLRAIVADSAWYAEQERRDRAEESTDPSLPRGLEDNATLSLFDVESPEP